MSVTALLLTLLVSAEPAVSSTPPSPAAATQETSTPEKVEETIVVTATRSERAVSSLPVSTTVVTTERIESAPVRSVDDLVRTIPGVHLTVVSASGSTPNNQRVSMRGLGGNRALILLDGIPIHDPYSGVAQWQKVTLESLSQVEVVRGGNTSLFGNFALGGTINLITKPVSSDEITLDASYGTGNAAQQRITLDRTVGDRIGARLSIDRLDSNGFVRVPNAGPVDEPAWIDNWIAAGRADVRISDASHAFLKGSLAQLDVSQGTAVTFTKRDVFETSGGLTQATRWNGLLTANAFYQHQEEHLVNSTILGERVSEFRSQESKTPSTVLGGSLEWSQQRSGRLPFVSFGVDYRATEAAENRITYNRSGAITQRNRVAGEQASLGVFAQTSWQPVERLEVLVSTRLDVFRNENGSDVVAGGESIRYPSASSTQLDPRISIRYAIGNSSALRASAYRAFGAPTLRDLYRKNQTGTSVVLGNPYLEPETLVGGEIGWEWAGNRGHVEVNVFRSTIDGYVSRANVPGQPSNVFQQMNLGTARSQGVEVSGDLRLSRQWSLNAGYTYADATIVDDPDPALVGNRIPEVPEHMGSLSVRYRGDHGTVVDVRGRALGRSHGDATNAGISPSHRVVDLLVSQQIRSGVDVYASLENAFDEHYYLALSPTALRSGLPRTFTGGVRLRVPGARR